MHFIVRKLQVGAKPNLAGMKKQLPRSTLRRIMKGKRRINVSKSADLAVSTIYLVSGARPSPWRKTRQAVLRQCEGWDYHLATELAANRIRVKHRGLEGAHGAAMFQYWAISVKTHSWRKNLNIFALRHNRSASLQGHDLKYTCFPSPTCMLFGLPHQTYYDHEARMHSVQGCWMVVYAALFIYLFIFVPLATLH